MEVVSDFRRIYHISALDVGDTISYSEGVLLLYSLLRDPSTNLHAVKAGWEHPVSWEWVALANIFDLIAQVNSPPKGKKPKPYPRPWRNPLTRVIGEAVAPINKAREFFRKRGFKV